jgi:hypothetical protein
MFVQAMAARCRIIGAPTASLTISTARTSKRPRCVGTSVVVERGLFAHTNYIETRSSKRVCSVLSVCLPAALTFTSVFVPSRYVENLENRIAKLEKLLSRVRFCATFFSPQTDARALQLYPDVNFTRDLDSFLDNEQWSNELVKRANSSASRPSLPSSPCSPTDIRVSDNVDSDDFPPSEDEFKQQTLAESLKKMQLNPKHHRFFGKSSGVNLVQTAIDLKNEVTGREDGLVAAVGRNHRAEYWAVRPVRSSRVWTRFVAQWYPFVVGDTPGGRKADIRLPPGRPAHLPRPSIFRPGQPHHPPPPPSHVREVGRRGTAHAGRPVRGDAPPCVRRRLSILERPAHLPRRLEFDAFLRVEMVSAGSGGSQIAIGTAVAVRFAVLLCMLQDGLSLSRSWILMQSL